MKLNLGLISTKKAAKIFVSQQQTFQKAFQSFQLSNTFNLANSFSFTAYDNTCGQLNAYATIDDVYSIVRWIAKTCKRVPFYAYEVTDQKNYNKYRVIQRKIQESKNYTNKNIWDLKELQTKSMEIIGESDKVQMLLDNPNDFQSKDEFYEACYAFPLLAGRQLLYVSIYDGGASRSQPYALFNLSPDFSRPVMSEEIKTFSRRILGWKYSLYGSEIPIQANGDNEAVLLRKYFNPNYDYAGSELLGLSPLHAAAKKMQQLINESDYLNRGLINAGAEGFVSSEDATEMSPEALGQLKDDVLKELGSSFDSRGSNRNAKKLGFLAGKWDYKNLFASPSDMQLVEQMKVTFKKLCNIYGISDRLFNNDATGSEISVDKMIKQAYTNTIIPEVSGERDLLHNGLLYRTNDLGLREPRYTDKQRVIDYDMSDIPELQEDQANIATRFAAAPVFRPNDFFEAMGWGRLDDPNAETVLIKQGYSPLADVATPIDVTNVDELNKANANDYK
jgi:phage portal protein BeeE